ncbi:MAG: TIGR02147 family protein [Chitinispirillaceae bacterium]|nr:TIGR02147 family protein [Chitinispirillaceae bacterium]
MKATPDNTIDIFNYFDYREYLQAVYRWKKEHEKGFSHRSFSREAGISSPNYLHRVLNGERSLSESYLEKFCNALKLSRNECQYFSKLVQFNNESDSSKKESLLRALLSLRYRRGIHRISDKKLQFFSKWYYPVIRELAAVLDFGDDYNLLARSCIPRITAQQAGNAVGYLTKNGFLELNENGKFVRTEPVLSSGNEVRSLILRKYHRQTLLQSIDALDTIEPENRDVSSLTLSVSKKTYIAMKKEIQDFRKRLLQMARNDANPEMVCLAGFQLLPRSRVHSRKQQQDRRR